MKSSHRSTRAGLVAAALALLAGACGEDTPDEAAGVAESAEESVSDDAATSGDDQLETFAVSGPVEASVECGVAISSKVIEATVDATNTTSDRVSATISVAFRDLAVPVEMRDEDAVVETTVELVGAVTERVRVESNVKASDIRDSTVECGIVDITVDEQGAASSDGGDAGWTEWDTVCQRVDAEDFERITGRPARDATGGQPLSGRATNGSFGRCGFVAEDGDFELRIWLTEPGARWDQMTSNAEPIAQTIDGAVEALYDENGGLFVELDGAPYFLQIEAFELGVPERDLDMAIETATTFIDG